MIYGIDALGLAAWPKEAIKALPRSFALGCFANTFGNVWPTLSRIGSRFPRVRVHAIWEDDHKYIPEKHDKIIKKEFAKFLEIASMSPATDWQFSPFCEVDGDLRPILTELREFYPRLVNSVWRGPTVKPALALNEVHGDHLPPPGTTWNYSTDGDSCVDMNMRALKKTHSRAETFYLWHAAFNGKLSDQDKTPRPERKAWPTPALIESIMYLQNPSGRVNLPENWIWKSHADRHMTPPEPRAYKPVLVATVQRPEMVLRNQAGEVVARMPYSGRYQDGVRHLYRLDDYGFKLAKANDNKTLIIEGHGRINPAFRAGSFR